MNHKHQNNLRIVHLQTEDNRYYCNQAVKSFDFKMTKEKDKVTCENCKKRYLNGKKI